MNNNDEIKVEVELLKKFNNKALNVIENKLFAFQQYIMIKIVSLSLNNSIKGDCLTSIR